MRRLLIPAIVLTLIMTAGSFARADDDDDRPVSQPQRARQAYTQQVYTQQQRQQQQRYYYRRTQQQPGFWSRLMDLERRKNRFLLRMIGINR